MSPKMEKIELEPVVCFLANKKKLSVRQLECLAEISRMRSQLKAAGRLGISAPVLNKYIRRAESSLGFPLVKKVPFGSALTPEGRALVEDYKKFSRRIEKRNCVTVGCTPITQDIAIKANASGFCIHIGDDRENLRLLEAGMLDLVIFDDPLYVYNWEGGGEHYDIFFDTLLHVRRGKEYAIFKYGAQRLGLEYLERNKIEHSVKREVSSLQALLDSKLSFFINKSLADREELKLKSATPLSEFRHAIVALKVGEDKTLDEFAEGVKRRVYK